MTSFVKSMKQSRYQAHQAMDLGCNEIVTPAGY